MASRAQSTGDATGTGKKRARGWTEGRGPCRSENPSVVERGVAERREPRIYPQHQRRMVYRAGLSLSSSIAFSGRVTVILLKTAAGWLSDSHAEDRGKCLLWDGFNCALFKITAPLAASLVVESVQDTVPMDSILPSAATERD